MEREKALNLVRQYKKHWTDGLREAIEVLIPELRESEDERIRKFLIDYFTSYKIGNVATKLNGYRIDDILAYLEKQKEQKPAEWSEEDERIRKAILGFLNPDKGGTKYSSNAELVEWSDWLKSLRPVSKESLQPHWKPSEEQMKAFKGYIQDFQERAEAAVGGWNNFDVMIRLYEQIKKLM